MPVYLESPSIRRIELDHVSEFPAAIRLLQDFPGKVEAIRGGSVLYHASRTLSELLKDQRFDPRRACNPDGGVYFTDLPIERWTNCEVQVAKDLIMFCYEYLEPGDLAKLELAGNGNF